jgi:hypothetical protein
MIVINNEEGEEEEGERVNSKRNTSLVYSLLIDVGTKREKENRRVFLFYECINEEKKKTKNEFSISENRHHSSY